MFCFCLSKPRALAYHLRVKWVYILFQIKLKFIPDNVNERMMRFQAFSAFKRYEMIVKADSVFFDYLALTAKAFVYCRDRRRVCSARILFLPPLKREAWYFNIVRIHKSFLLTLCAALRAEFVVFSEFVAALWAKNSYVIWWCARSACFFCGAFLWKAVCLGMRLRIIVNCIIFIMP